MSTRQKKRPRAKTIELLPQEAKTPEEIAEVMAKQQAEREKAAKREERRRERQAEKRREARLATTVQSLNAAKDALDYYERQQGITLEKLLDLAIEMDETSIAITRKKVEIEMLEKRAVAARRSSKRRAQKAKVMKVEKVKALLKKVKALEAELHEAGYSDDEIEKFVAKLVERSNA